MIAAREIRLCVATPTHDGRVHAAHAASVEAIGATCAANGIEYSRVLDGGSQLARLRCLLVERARANRATHILMLDDDIALPHAGRALDQLLGTMARLDADLVSAACMIRPALGTSASRGLVGVDIHGALARLRSEPIRWASSVLTADGQMLGIAPQADGRPLVPGPGETLLLGTGCLLIRMTAFDRFAPGEAPFQFADGLGEDHWFSREVQRRGGRAAIDPRPATVHYGSTGWIWEGTGT